MELSETSYENSADHVKSVLSKVIDIVCSEEVLPVTLEQTKENRIPPAESDNVRERGHNKGILQNEELVLETSKTFNDEPVEVGKLVVKAKENVDTAMGSSVERAAVQMKIALLSFTTEENFLPCCEGDSVSDEDIEKPELCHIGNSSEIIVGLKTSGCIEQKAFLKDDAVENDCSKEHLLHALSLGLAQSSSSFPENVKLKSETVHFTSPLAVVHEYSIDQDPSEEDTQSIEDSDRCSGEFIGSHTQTKIVDMSQSNGETCFILKDTEETSCSPGLSGCNTGKCKELTETSCGLDEKTGEYSGVYIMSPVGDCCYSTHEQSSRVAPYKQIDTEEKHCFSAVLDTGSKDQSKELEHMKDWTLYCVPQSEAIVNEQFPRVATEQSLEEEKLIDISCDESEELFADKSDLLDVKEETDKVLKSDNILPIMDETNIQETDVPATPEDAKLSFSDNDFYLNNLSVVREAIERGQNISHLSADLASRKRENLDLVADNQPLKKLKHIEDIDKTEYEDTCLSCVNTMKRVLCDRMAEVDGPSSKFAKLDLDQEKVNTDHGTETNIVNESNSSGVTDEGNNTALQISYKYTFVPDIGRNNDPKSLKRIAAEKIEVMDDIVEFETLIEVKAETCKASSNDKVDETCTEDILNTQTDIKSPIPFQELVVSEELTPLGMAKTVGDHTDLHEELSISEDKGESQVEKENRRMEMCENVKTTEYITEAAARLCDNINKTGEGEENLLKSPAFMPASQVLSQSSQESGSTGFVFDCSRSCESYSSSQESVKLTDSENKAVPEKKVIVEIAEDGMCQDVVEKCPEKVFVADTSEVLENVDSLKPDDLTKEQDEQIDEGRLTN